MRTREEPREEVFFCCSFVCTLQDPCNAFPNCGVKIVKRVKFAPQPCSMRRKTLVFSFLIVLCVLLFALNISIGSVAIPFKEVVKILFGEEGSKLSWTYIIMISRLPGALTALIAGAALAVSGLLVQTLFRNPLAGPSVLGISSGASLGVALVMLAAGGSMVISYSVVAAAAMCGAALVLFLVLLVAQRMRDNVTMLIFGLMAGYIISSVVSVLEFQSEDSALRSFIHWSFGSFSGMTWQQLQILALSVGVGAGLSFFVFKPMDAWLLGEEHAESVGVNTNVTRILVILIVGILAGAVTAFCGPIAFLGLATPHLARGLWPETRHLYAIPLVALVGAILALLCDIISRSPGATGVLPLNAVTSMVGAPVVIWVILRNRYRSLF